MNSSAESENISPCHHYNRANGYIEFITNNENIYRILKNTHDVCGEVFACPHCKVVHLGIEYDKVFLGLSLCDVCIDAIDSVSTVPFVITNALTGERHRLELHLLK